MLIVGLGTGRCGTKSLAELLRLNGFDAAHERKPALRWSGEPDPARHFRVAGAMFADVGFYYLPHVRRLMCEFHDLRCICLRRSRSETIESFVRCQPIGSNWFSNDGQPSEWDKSFPHYGCDFAEAVGRYNDDYYRDADTLRSSRFRIFPTESLNCQCCVEGILRFAGVHSPNVVTGIRLTH